ncbi:hypothetical protein RJ639_032104 [Escallonia herrerae]|uniref:Uncharacterized protein n=1 Tax=Escallonia herrerae TaxID=1293975 RepID=A0AA88X0H8_9ASTE|nr:hypothetical protein RJ639_032104 [Escallonia herrerae]
MALAQLFHCFDWTPPDGVRPEDIDTSEVYGMTMPKARPLMANAKPRLPGTMAVVARAVSGGGYG